MDCERIASFIGRDGIKHGRRLEVRDILSWQREEAEKAEKKLLMARSLRENVLWEREQREIHYLELKQWMN
jgi:hypothetical protein